MMRSAKKTKQPPAPSTSAALLNASYGGPRNSSIPSSLRNYEIGNLTAPISASTEAIVAEEDNECLVPRMTRRHSDTAYPAVRGRRGWSPSHLIGPKTQQHSSPRCNAKVCMLIGVAVVLVVSVAGVVNMMLETEELENSESHRSVQPKQAASPAANDSDISNQNGTTAESAKTTKPTKWNQVPNKTPTATMLTQTGDIEGAVDNASSGGITPEPKPGNESVASDDGATQGVLGLTSQGLAHVQVRSDTKLSGEMTHRTVLPSSRPTQKYLKQTTPKAEKQTNTHSRNKQASAHHIVPA